MTLPKWATPERQAQLIGLWEQHGNRCLLGHPTCPELAHYVDPLTGQLVGGRYFLVEETLVHEWVADDRAERAALLQAEQERLHPRELIYQGRFDSLAREIYRAEHPLYFLELLGITALSKRRVARVRIACSPVRLWVELPSKNAIRQAKRYGREGPKSLNEAITQAVHEYQNS